MSERVFYFHLEVLKIISKLPRGSKDLWFELVKQSVPGRRAQTVKTSTPLKVVKPLLDRGLIKKRFYAKRPIKGSYVINSDLFYCSSESTPEEIFLSTNRSFCG